VGHERLVSEYRPFGGSEHDIGERPVDVGRNAECRRHRINPQHQQRDRFSCKATRTFAEHNEVL
jgi:hypothetical protein